MDKKPRIADVHCIPLRFQPGDRILVRTRVRLDPEQQKRLHKTIERWAGGVAEVLIYCDLDYSIEVERSKLALK